MKIFAILVSLLLGYSDRSSAQIREVPLNELLDNSTYIFEGSVLSTSQVWNRDSSWNYAFAIVQITKVFKGGLACGTIEVIMPGNEPIKKSKEKDGSVNLQVIESEHGELRLETGQKGIFLCNKTKLPTKADTLTNRIATESYAGQQGFIQYTSNNHKTVAHRFSSTYNDLDSLYLLIDSRTGIMHSNCSP